MALAFFGSAASAGLAPEFHLEHRRDVILFIADDMRPETGCTSVLGTSSADMHTPEMCKLAEESLKLTRYHAAFAKCAPSRASFLTSRLPHTTRVWDLYSCARSLL